MDGRKPRDVDPFLFSEPNPEDNVPPPKHLPTPLLEGTFIFQKSTWSYVQVPQEGVSINVACVRKRGSEVFLAIHPHAVLSLFGGVHAGHKSFYVVHLRPKHFPDMKVLQINLSFKVGEQKMI